MGLISGFFSDFSAYLSGGNPKVAAKSTAEIFAEGLQWYGSYDAAYRHTYIFRNNTITKNARCPRDYSVSEMFQSEEILNCTYITVANLNTSAAPQNVVFYQTYNAFCEKISSHLREYGIPEQYVSGDNRACIKHVAKFIREQYIVPPTIRESLILADSASIK